MMSKLTTEYLKDFVLSEIIKNKKIVEELEGYEITDLSTKSWKRRQKARINKNDLVYYEFLYNDDDIDTDVECGFGNFDLYEGMGIKPNISFKDLEGCWIRTFLHKDKNEEIEDVEVRVITDPIDESIVSWYV